MEQIDRSYETALAQLIELEEREQRSRHRIKLEPFLIRVKKHIFFRVGGYVVDILNPGDYIVATATNDRGGYYVASPGGLYFNEAERIEIDRLAEDYVAVLGYN